MKVTTPPGRLLWNHPATVGLCGLSLLVTASIIALQIARRAGVYDPEWVQIFDRLFLFDDFAAAWLFLASLLVAMIPAVQRVGSELARWVGDHPVRTAALALAALAVGAKFVYLAHPLAMDESAPYMQSRIFAAGALLGRFPVPLVDWLVYPSFQGHFIRVSHQTGEVASAYWPGFALLLTPFTAAGVPWLCNPVLGALSIWVIGRLALQLTGRAEVAGAAMLFTLASAAFAVNSISFYSMTAHLLLNAVYVLLLIEPSARRSLAAGVIGGLALTLHNPVPHILFAAPWVLWLLWRSDRFRNGAALFAGYLPWVVVAGFGWHQMTQALAPIAADGTLVTSLGPMAEMKRQLFAVLRPPDLVLLDARMVGLAKLWLWAVPAMLPLAVVGSWRHRYDPRFRLLIASAALTFIGFLFVPVSQGHGWGFRYFHSAWFVLPLLAAAAVAAASESACARLDERSGQALGRYVQGAALVGLVVLTPFFAWRVHGFIAGHLEQLPIARHGEPRLVIVNPYTGYYAPDLVQNDPFLRDPVIRMITHGRRNDEAMLAQHFPDLELLARSYRGSVWGYPETSAGKSAGVAVGGNQHRQ